ncbi:MAG TPA: hypothetical protein VF988_17820 [Verrucomicrobiae bacterium]
MFSLYGLNQKTRKRWQTLADQCQRHLAEQKISPAQPGTILKDVGMLLEFIGLDGILTKSRNASLPAELLPELNVKTSHPVQLCLKRALLRDYPNLAGIFVLLRVMGLLQMQGNRLVVCPAAWDLWRNLNFTEQYFALLEALLFLAESSVLTDQPNRREEVPAFETAAAFLGQLSERWRNFDHYESVRLLGPQGELPTWHLFALQQLGLIELRPREFIERERNDWGGRGWLVGGARLTAWGTAVTWALLEALEKMGDEEEFEGDKATLEVDEFSTMNLPLFDAGADKESNSLARPDGSQAEDEPEAEPAESESAAEFGKLQPIFHPYFPEWQNLYARPGREVRKGTHIFKVTVAGWRGGGGIWRRLAVPPELSLDELAEAILRAFKFDSDHLYDFRFRDQRGKQRVYHHPYTDEGPFTPEIAVGEIDLAIKDTMIFTFDYGDHWEFAVRLEQVEAKTCRQQCAKVIASVGKAPEQYPMFEA